MPLKADYHLHSSFSEDSQAPMEKMIQQAIALGLTDLCFTEHMDMDYACRPEDPAHSFEVDTASYLSDFLKYKEQYQTINLSFGVEIGLQPHLFLQNAAYIKQYPFDFVIASSHICHRQDPYFPSFYEGRSEAEAYHEYFESILENILVFTDFDIYGHLDYVVRYGPNKDLHYHYEDYLELFDEILRKLIAQGKGIEVNTGGLRQGLKDIHPITSLLKRYRDLGGEILTIGSDAHKPEHLGSHFDRAEEVLLKCGFQYYTIFKNRKPIFKKL